MAVSFKPERLKRYKDIVALLIKYGRSDLVKQTDLNIAGGERAWACRYCLSVDAAGPLP